MATMSVSGVVSGMDWDSMIDELITKAAKPAQVKVNKKTNLTNKKSLFEEMKVTMNSLQSSLSPLKLPSTYKAKTIDIERIDTSGSYKGVLTATVNADAEVNVWDLKVNKLATAQVNRSKQITSSSLASTLNGLTSSTFYVNMGGQKVGIEVNSTDTLQSLKSRINNTLKTLDNPLAVTASVVDNKLILKSDNTGLGTRTATETINYNNSGINRLSNISVTKSDAKNLKITSGGKSYTYGTDFTVANGNEIRWKQNDRSKEVALNDTVSVKYTMAADDVYKATGKYGSDEAAISKIGIINNGTLSDRLYILDEDGTTKYEYGKDFTLDDNNKVVWIENPTVDDSPKYNEPDSYTVNLTKEVPVSVSKSYTKSTETDEPDTYTVSYTKAVNGSYSVTGDKVSATKAPKEYTVTYDKTFTATVPGTSERSVKLTTNSAVTGSIPSFADMTGKYGLTTTSATNTILDINGSDSDSAQILINGVDAGYVYGENSDGGSFTFRRSTSNNSDTIIYWIPKESKPTVDYTVKYTHTYSADASDSSYETDVSALIAAAGTDTRSIKITGPDGTVYDPDTDYDIDADTGKIIWKLKGEVIDIPKTDTDSTGEPPSTEGFTTLQAKYAEAYDAKYGESAELKTVTLIDGDGVLRTYVDPDDPSIFTMSAGGKDYEYGRDYVLRVNDSGTGYRFEWAVEGDTNHDGSTDVRDFSTVVATYAAYKNINTSDWQEAPADEKPYAFGFDYTFTDKGSATVNKSDDDSSKNAFDLLGLTSLSDADTITITDSDGTIRTDCSIDTDGKITWSGKTPTADDKFTDITLLQSAYSNTTGSSSIPRITLTDSNGVLRTYLDLADSDVNFQLSDASGKAYTYGRDYVIRVSDDGEGYVISWADANNDGTKDINNFNPVVAAYASEKDIDTLGWRAAPASGNFTFATTSTKTINLSGNVQSTTADDDKTLAKILNPKEKEITSADYSSVSIPGYTQGRDYVINSDGKIRWLDLNSKTPEAYKATYTFSETTPSTTLSNIESTESVTRRFNRSGTMPSLSDMGVKTFVGDKLTNSTAYYYVDEAEGKAAFTLTDSAGNTYEYGKDFAIRCASLTSTDLYLDMSNHGSWPLAFSNQEKKREIPEGEMLTLTYNNTVTRFVDSEETLAAGLGFTPNTSKLTLTDTYGKVYTEGTDYTIDSTGKVSWAVQGDGTFSSYTAIYKLGDKASFTSNVSPVSGQYTRLTGSNIPSLGSLAVSTISSSDSDGTSYDYITKEYGQAAFTLTLNDGTVWEYAKDYAIRGGGNGLDVVYTENSSWPSSFEKSGVGRPSIGYTLSYTNLVSGSGNESSDISDVLGLTPADYNNLTITYGNGKTYTYTASEDTLTDDTFTIVNGNVKVKSTEKANHPTGSYTLVYKAFDPFKATDTVSSDNTQAANISADNYGHIDGDKLSYEQICSFAGASSTSTDQDSLDSSLSQYFTLTVDGDATTYTYGTDYRVIKSSTTDSDSGEHVAMIEWIEDGKKPANDASFTLTFTGGSGEVLTTDGVTRSAADTINPNTSSITRASYSTFAAASEIRITNGDKEYFLNKDFTISESTDGLSTPVINWNTDSEWYNNTPDSTDTYTLYVTGNGVTTTYTGTRTAKTDTLSLEPIISYPKASDFASGTTTITQGTKTFYEGEDFNIKNDADGRAQICWIEDDNDGTEWYYPNPGTSYTINHTDSNGNTTSYTAYRSSYTTLNMADYGLTTANGSITVSYNGTGYNLDAMGDESGGITGVSGHDVIKSAFSIDINDRGNGSYLFNWVTPTLTSRTDLPSYGDELTVEYEYDANTFTITGEAADLLGLNDEVTEANDAELELDGELVYRASNDIGADYDNELIKGVTMHLKGTGEVSLDISHDAQKAVESIQTFVDTYNDLMSWMNTRMTESEVDSDTKATIDSDDFRMRWGLLHGNSLLRNTKSQMRSLVSQNFTFSFTQRKSSSEIYGTMGYNGLKSTSTLRLRIGTKYVDVTIDPTDTLQTIVDKINDDTKGGPMNDIYYDDDGNKLQTPLLRVSADNDVLTINSTSSDAITMSGSAAMNALKMNYTYKGLYQIGIETTSDDYGKSGELVFDTDEFMTALEDNPDEVQELMLMFITQFDTWTKSMLTSSASGETSGTLTREIENLQSQIDDINDYLEDYQDRLDRMEEQLRTKYANTETSLAKLTQQASSIAAILNQLNGYTSSSSDS